MSDMAIGTRVRALQQISSGYGEGRRVVEPGQEGTVRAFSRTKRYPQVEWDAGWSSLCRPDDVESIPDLRHFAPDDVALPLRESAASSLAIAGIAAKAIEGDGVRFSIHLRNGQRFTVTVEEGASNGTRGGGGVSGMIGGPGGGSEPGDEQAGVLGRIRGILGGRGS